MPLNYLKIIMLIQWIEFIFSFLLDELLYLLRIIAVLTLIQRRLADIMYLGYGNLSRENSKYNIWFMNHLVLVGSRDMGAPPKAILTWVPVILLSLFLINL